MSQLDDALLPVFARQHWLVTLADVHEAGGSEAQIWRRTAIGRWQVADERVYRLVGAPSTWHGRVLTPLLSCGTGAAASHSCAAALHGIPGFGQGAPEISVVRGSKFRRTEVRVHTSTDLDRCRIVLRQGIPTTDINRTLLDVGRHVGDQRLGRAIEFARRAELTTWSELIQNLTRHARRGRPGVARMRRVIAANAHRAEVTDSDFELLVIALLLEHGLPEPVLHHRVLAGDRFVAEVDLAYPELRLAIELDGRIHAEEEIRERDLPRQNDLILSGWTVLRFTYRRFQERPLSIVAEVRDARRLARRAVS